MNTLKKSLIGVAVLGALAFAAGAYDVVQSKKPHYKNPLAVSYDHCKPVAEFGEFVAAQKVKGTSQADMIYVIASTPRAPHLPNASKADTQDAISRIYAMQADIGDVGISEFNRCLGAWNDDTEVMNRLLAEKLAYRAQEDARIKALADKK